MIEINLITKGKETDLSNIGGINFSLINLKYVVVAIILVFTLRPIIDILYGADIKSKELKITELRKTVREKENELRQYDSVKQQVKELDEQQTKLKAKIDVVKKIVEMRKNPFNVLKYIAENTPANVWVIDLTLEAGELQLMGYSTSWKAIGDYIENLKTSIFFNGNVTYEKPSELKEEFNKKRVETFKIKTKLVGF